MNLDEIRFLKELGERIRNRRTELQLTQQQLAERSHLHRTFIGAVERGERNIAVLNLRVIAKALRLSLAQLLS